MEFHAHDFRAEPSQTGSFEKDPLKTSKGRSEKPKEVRIHVYDPLRAQEKPFDLKPADLEALKKCRTEIEARRKAGKKEHEKTHKTTRHVFEPPKPSASVPVNPVSSESYRLGKLQSTFKEMCVQELRPVLGFETFPNRLETFIAGLTREELMKLTSDLERLSKEDPAKILFTALRENNKVLFFFLCVAGRESPAVAQALQVREPRTLLIEAIIGNGGVFDEHTLKIVQVLLKLDPTLVNIREKQGEADNGYTPLMFAACSRCKSKEIGMELIDSLLAAGASNKPIAKGGVGATMLAQDHDNLYMLPRLMQAFFKAH